MRASCERDEPARTSRLWNLGRFFPVLAESSAAWPKGDHVLAAALLPGTPLPSRRTQEGPPNQKAYPCIDHTSLKAAGRPACGAVQTASPAEGRPGSAARILRDFVSLLQRCRIACTSIDVLHRYAVRFCCCSPRIFVSAPFSGRPASVLCILCAASLLVLFG